MMMVAWFQNNSGNATETDPVAWAETYGATFPFVADLNSSLINATEGDGYIPSLHLIGPGLEVITLDGNVTDAQIESYLPN